MADQPRDPILADAFATHDAYFNFLATERLTDRVEPRLIPEFTQWSQLHYEADKSSVASHPDGPPMPARAHPPPSISSLTNAPTCDLPATPSQIPIDKLLRCAMDPAKLDAFLAWDREQGRQEHAQQRSPEPSIAGGPPLLYSPAIRTAYAQSGVNIPGAWIPNRFVPIDPPPAAATAAAAAAAPGPSPVTSPVAFRTNILPPFAPISPTPVRPQGHRQQQLHDEEHHGQQPRRQEHQQQEHHHQASHHQAHHQQQHHQPQHHQEQHQHQQAVFSATNDGRQDTNNGEQDTTALQRLGKLQADYNAAVRQVIDLQAEMASTSLDALWKRHSQRRQEAQAQAQAQVQAQPQVQGQGQGQGDRDQTNVQPQSQIPARHSTVSPAPVVVGPGDERAPQNRVPGVNELQGGNSVHRYRKRGRGGSMW